MYKNSKESKRNLKTKDFTDNRKFWSTKKQLFFKISETVNNSKNKWIYLKTMALLTGNILLTNKANFL